MRIFDNSENDRHEKGVLTCQGCEQPARLHPTCGGVLHAEKRPAHEVDGIYIYRCDRCHEYA
jgi:hypothetical protein